MKHFKQVNSLPLQNVNEKIPTLFPVVGCHQTSVGLSCSISGQAQPNMGTILYLRLINQGKQMGHVMRHT